MLTDNTIAAPKQGDINKYYLKAVPTYLKGDIFLISTKFAMDIEILSDLDARKQKSLNRKIKKKKSLGE